jgi:penicillin-binding protein 1B
VASEDRRFRHHLGIDLKANARALVRNVEAHGVREGGSTITQQLARALFLGTQRTLARKLAEMPLAVGLELVLDKPKILEMYLNGIYWGQAGSVGIGGIAEAARWYFDLPVDSLGLTQAALLAGIIPAPNTFDPFEHPDAARERRDAVLDDMVASKVLTPEARDRAREQPLGVRRGPPPVERFPSYCGYVRDVLARGIGRHAAAGWGLDVFTRMDLVGQSEAERVLDGAVARLGRGLQGAFVALDPATAGVTVLVGGRGLKEGDFNRAFQARRQTGSAIKPIVYAAALSVGGGSFTPGSTVPDEKRSFGSGRWAWTPANYDGSYHASVTLAAALARSLNVATANLVDQIGAGTVADVAARFGLGRLKPVASIGLGTNETSLLALTNAYDVFASGGMYREASPIRTVVDGTGAVLLGPPEEASDALPPQTAALMTGLLEDVVRYGVGHPLRSSYGFDRPVAGKTGTTNDYRDAWFVGYVPQLVAGAWAGYDRPRSLGRPAAQVAIPVWAAIMSRLVGDLPPDSFATDRQLEYAVIDPWTGLLADSTCDRMNVPFLYGTAPTMLCSHAFDYQLASQDSSGIPGRDWSRDTTWVDPEQPEPRPTPAPEPETPAPSDTTVQEGAPTPTPPPHSSGGVTPWGVADPDTTTLLRWQQLWTRRSWSLA